jgi:glycosyltransferase involved in cell wall biosynthesis
MCKNPMPPLKSLIFAKKIRLPSPAANIIQSLNMAWAFRAAGCDVHLFPGYSQKKSLSLIQDIEEKYCLNSNTRPKISLLPAKNKGMYGLLFRSQLIREWVSNSDSVFFCRDLKEAVFLLKLKKLIKRHHKIIYEMHDSVFIEHEEYAYKDADRCKNLEKQIISKIDGIIYTNAYIKKKIQEIYSPSIPSITSVPGYNSRIFTPVSAPTNNSRILVGYFGSLHPGKGVDLLIEAFKKLPDNYYLRIVGGNPPQMQKTLENMVQKEFDLPGRIEFTGQVSPGQVRSHLEDCHFVCIPFVSQVEFLSPIKLYESIGMELPVVATPMPAILETSRELQSLVLAKDTTPEALASAIRQLGDDPEQMRQLKKNARLLRSEYTWEKRAGKIVSFISSTR